MRTTGKCLCILLVLIGLGLLLIGFGDIGGGSAEAGATTAKTDIIFLHHSTGENIWNGGVSQWFIQYKSQRSFLVVFGKIDNGAAEIVIVQKGLRDQDPALLRNILIYNMKEINIQIHFYEICPTTSYIKFVLNKTIFKEK